MFAKPEKFLITAAAAEGNHTLAAFDAALLKANIGNVNLVRISSILPPGCREEKEAISFPAGAFVPTAYGAISSGQKDELIAAAVGIGFSKNSYGVIMEFAGYASEEEARARVEGMIREAFANRGRQLEGIQLKSVEHRVEKNGAVVAAVVLW